MSNFTHFNKNFKADSSKRVAEIQIKLISSANSGTVGITDVMLQRGSISTEWSAHPSEIKWTLND